MNRRHLSYRRNSTLYRWFGAWYIDRISLLKWIVVILFTLILGRLFELQVLRQHEFTSFAEQRLRSKVISARRGRILLKDGENDFFELANNVSLELLFADPWLIQDEIRRKAEMAKTKPKRAASIKAPNPQEVAQTLAPLLFEMVKERSAFCNGETLCLAEALDNEFFAAKRARQLRAWEEAQRQLQENNSPVHSSTKGTESDKEDNSLPNIDTKALLNTEETPSLFEIQKPQLKTEAELLQEYISDLSNELSKSKRDFVILKTEVGNEVIQQVEELSIPGIGTSRTTVYANPLQIDNKDERAKQLQSLLELPVEVLSKALSVRDNRYFKIMNKIDFETAEQIRALNIKGIGFYDEHWRLYAEQENRPFAPQVLGFLDNDFNPVYGIEKSMNTVLAGKRGVIKGEVDLRGRTLTARNNQIEQAINGTDIVLSLDQVIQNKIEEFLEQQVKESDARSGEVIVQDPQTGQILAMASYPGFNPNSPGDAYERIEFELTPEEEEALEVKATKDGKRYFHYYNPGYKIEVFKRGNRYYRYANKEGIRVYRNPIVSDIYEPGSTFKAIVMAAAIDAQEIAPFDVFQDKEPLKVDCHYAPIGNGEKEYKCDYTIKNSTNKYYGRVTMTQILEKSLNTGMAFVAKKIGPVLLYDYLSNFGFGELSFVELPEENTGKLPHYRNWISESDFITKAFGQGVATTPIQVINAFSAVINGGLLMQPTLLAGSLNEDGEFIEQPARIVRRVITPETSELMRSMLVSAVSRGVANPASIQEYKIGGKTGTSQIATGGLYEKGDGSTIASFVGFAPYENPKFSILVKINRPRTSPWGATNAAPLFKKISEFLLNYLQIPPDDKEYSLDRSSS